MVRIRLRRVGAKKQPHYRVVVADQRSPRDGRHIETIGYYDPRTEPETVHIKEDRALYWLSMGAQPSDVVKSFLDKQGTMDRLARLKAGESLDVLVAEYEADVTVQDDAEPEEAQAVEAVAEVEEETPAAEVVEPEADETPAAEVVEPEAEETPAAEAVEPEAEETESEPSAETELEAPIDEG
jgi:small subunit ribosomal protein S16